MISDESSSDSETGRFKCHTKKKDDQLSLKKDSDFRFSNRNVRGTRPRDDRFQRDFDRRKDERQRYARRSKERQRSSRYSPVTRRKRSTDRNVGSTKRSPEPRHRRNSPLRGHHSRDNRSCSRDKKDSRSVSRKRETQKGNIDLKDSLDDAKLSLKSNEFDKKRKRCLTSSDKIKMSLVHKPELTSKKESPIHVLEEVESDKSEGIQPASYYNMIPVVKDKSEDSSVTDSSDDEKLRAKLLNLEKELRKTRKKKHKKKHKKKSSKTKTKEKDKDTSTSVEVSSTTDIQEKKDPDNTIFLQPDVVEVSSTQSKPNKKDTSEEGEISSDDSNKGQINIEPTDLRHKLKRSVQAVERSISPDLREKLQAKQDICGPALPPHLQKKFKKSISPDVDEVEGPVLPPHLKVERNIGPTIPTEMRKVLADADHTITKYESSEEEGGGIGPVPVDFVDITSETQRQLEERALSMKIKQLEGHTLQDTDTKTREKWMLELPEGKRKYLGLEARTFRAREGPDLSDRSCWTDTPEQRARKEAGLLIEDDPKVNLEQEAKAKHIAERDSEYEKAVKKHKKKHKREESLLDMHQKKLKKKKKKEEKEDGKGERRPFNRETDMQVNRFDEAQKKAIIKKAQNLDSRFSSGEAKYL